MEELGIGFAVMLGDERRRVPRRASDTERALEMGVVTRTEHRRRGYGALVSRLVARACEARGDRVRCKRQCRERAVTRNRPGTRIPNRASLRARRLSSTAQTVTRSGSSRTMEP